MTISPPFFLLLFPKLISPSLFDGDQHVLERAATLFFFLGFSSLFLLSIFRVKGDRLAPLLLVFPGFSSPSPLSFPFVPSALIGRPRWRRSPFFYFPFLLLKALIPTSGDDSPPFLAEFFLPFLARIASAASELGALRTSAFLFSFFSYATFFPPDPAMPRGWSRMPIERMRDISSFPLFFLSSFFFFVLWYPDRRKGRIGAGRTTLSLSPPPFSRLPFALQARGSTNF